MKNISEYINQVYIVHQTGLSVLVRRYKLGCVNSDPQLIGGFISALSTFVTNAAVDAIKKCPGDKNGAHRMTEIGTTCAHWYIYTVGEHHAALLIPNESPVLGNNDFLRRVGGQIIETIGLFREFNIDADENIDEADKDKEENLEFGNTIDNILVDGLADLTGNKINIDLIGDLEQFEK